jgi:hypothetical protein
MKTPIRRNPIFLLLTVLFIASFAAMIFYRGPNVSAMNCEIYDKKRFDEILAIEISEDKARRPTAEESSKVGSFLLKDFNAFASSEDSILSIRSDRAGGTIYIGPYKEHIKIEMPENLFSANERDNFSIMVANKRTKQICSAEHSAYFWQPERQVTIKMLERRELDKNGYPVAFAVSYD